MTNGSRSRFAALSVAAALVAALICTVSAKTLAKHYVLRYDPQQRICLPWRLYVAESSLRGTLRRGDLVAVRIPGSATAMKRGAVLGKIVAGVPGDIVEVANGSIFVNREYWGDLDLLPTLGRPAASYARHEAVPVNHYLVLGSGPYSYDGRYWGYVEAGQIIGRIGVVF